MKHLYEETPGRVFAENLLKIGMANFTAGNYNAAVMMLAQALRADKNNWEARFYLARACSKARMVDDAIAHFSRIIKHCPETDFRDKAVAALTVLGVKADYRLLQPLQSSDVSVSA